MYCVVDSNDNTVAICSRKEDAAAWLRSDLDKKEYRIKYLTSKQ